MNTGELIALLGIPEQPTTGEVRVARRQLAKQLHPDLSRAPRAATAMAEVNAACDRLIAAIRRGDHRPVRNATVDAASVRIVPPIRVRRLDFRPVYAAITLAAMLASFTVALMYTGMSPAGLGAGLLVAAVVGGLTVGAVLAYLQRR